MISSRTKKILDLTPKVYQEQEQHPRSNSATDQSMQRGAVLSSSQNRNNDAVSPFQVENEDHSVDYFSEEFGGGTSDVDEVIPYEIQENENNNYFSLPSNTLEALSSSGEHPIYTPLLPVQTIPVPNFDKNSTVLTDNTSQGRSPFGFIALTSTCTIADGSILKTADNLGSNNNSDFNELREKGVDVEHVIQDEVQMEDIRQEDDRFVDAMASNKNQAKRDASDQEVTSDSEDNLPLINFAATGSKVNSTTNYTKKGTVRKRKKARSVEERNKLKEEQKNTLIKKHTVLPGCTNKCRKKCYTFFSEEQRSDINNGFWKLTSGQRKSFILSTCDRLETKKK